MFYSCEPEVRKKDSKSVIIKIFFNLTINLSIRTFYFFLIYKKDHNMRIYFKNVNLSSKG